MRLRRADHVLWRSTPGWLVLGDEAGELTEVHGPAAVLWELLSTPADLAALSNDLAELYGADSDRVLADLRPLIEQLLARGVLAEAAV